MKVERKTEFTPITITLETEEEAKWMWACLCDITGVTETFKCYLKNEHQNITIKTNMWQEFNKQYDPRKR